MLMRGLRACGFAIALGCGMVLLLFMPVLAQGGAPVGPGGGKGPTPTPTVKAVPTQSPLLAAPAGLDFVDLSSSSYTAQGTHAGETVTYSLVAANSGSTPALASEVKTHVPANTTFVPGSAHVQGGGTLTVNGGLIGWTGSIVNGAAVTITFRTQLPAAIGAQVSTTASLYDPGAAAVVVLTNRTTTQAPTGGPDASGYLYRDSLAPSNPVAFSWVPTTTPADKLDFGPFPNDDNVTGPVSIGFPFQFYTGTYTQTYINTNGMVMFGAQNAANESTGDEPIPSLDGSHNYASCLSSDLFQLDPSQGVWVDHHGVSPTLTLVVTFRTAFFVAQHTTPGLFQMILSQGSNQIKCQYTQTPVTFPANGAAGTIGVANADGTRGLPYARSESDQPDITNGPIEDGLAVLFTRDTSHPLYGASTLDASYNVHPGDTPLFTVAARNTSAVNGTSTTVDNPIPPGVSYVGGSGHVVGGGVLNASAAGIHWTGSVTAGQSITITFRLKLPTTLGTFVTDTATISDAQALAPVMLVNPYPLRVLPAPTGGPDTFGYTFKDSFAPTNPVTFSWVPTTTPAARLDFGPFPNDDIVTGPVALGFTFTFYGRAYTQTYVSTNGLVSFGGGSPANINEPIPTNGGSLNFATCFWDDLYQTAPPQGVWLETHGVAPNRYAVITYETAYFEQQNVAPSTFQIILYESSNQIKCQYLDMSGPIDASGGGGASVGAENADGTAGVQYFFQQIGDGHPIVGPLEDGLAVLFTPGPAAPSLSASFKAITPLVHAGERVTYTVVISNDGPGNASPATMNDPIPPGAIFQAGSAQVVGGGSLTANAANVNWSGTLNSGHEVTVTFAVKLPAVGPVTNTASFNAPQAIVPLVRSVGTYVQPATAFGVGQPSYRYADSYAPGISYSWVVTTGASQHVSSTIAGNSDDGYISVPLGFNFPFFDRVYTSTFVSTNGLVMFNGTGSVAEYGQPIPTPGLVDNFASCFWSDQVIGVLPGEGFWYEAFGSQPNRYAVITFVLEDKIHVGLPYRYQMILFENGNIKCQYQDMRGVPFGTGRFATIGVEGRFGNSGVQYYAGPEQNAVVGPVENKLAILFAPLKMTFLPVIRR